MQSCQSKIVKFFKNDATLAIKTTKDLINPNRFLSPAPAGLSQLSRLPDEDIEEDLLSNCDFLEDDFDVGTTHTRFNVSREFNEAAEAVNNSHDKIGLEIILKGKLREVILLARQTMETPVGERISMLPSNNKRRITHGT